MRNLLNFLEKLPSPDVDQAIIKAEFMRAEAQLFFTLLYLGMGVFIISFGIFVYSVSANKGEKVETIAYFGFLFAMICFGFAFIM